MKITEATFRHAASTMHGQHLNGSYLLSIVSLSPRGAFFILEDGEKAVPLGATANAGYSIATWRISWSGYIWFPLDAIASGEVYLMRLGDRDGKRNHVERLPSGSDILHADYQFVLGGGALVPFPALPPPNDGAWMFQYEPSGLQYDPATGLVTAWNDSAGFGGPDMTTVSGVVVDLLPGGIPVARFDTLTDDITSTAGIGVRLDVWRMFCVVRADATATGGFNVGANEGIEMVGLHTVSGNLVHTHNGITQSFSGMDLRDGQFHFIEIYANGADGVLNFRLDNGTLGDLTYSGPRDWLIGWKPRLGNQSGVATTQLLGAVGFYSLFDATAGDLDPVDLDAYRAGIMEFFNL